MPDTSRISLHPQRFHTFGRRETHETQFTERLTASHKQFIKQFLHQPPPPSQEPQA